MPKTIVLEKRIVAKFCLSHEWPQLAVVRRWCSGMMSFAITIRVSDHFQSAQFAAVSGMQCGVFARCRNVLRQTVPFGAHRLPTQAGQPDRARNRFFPITIVNKIPSALAAGRASSRCHATNSRCARDRFLRPARRQGYANCLRQDRVRPRYTEQTVRKDRFCPG